MKRVTGVRTTLETSDYRILSCKDVNDLSFSFVSLLETEYNIKFHVGIFFSLNYSIF